MTGTEEAAGYVSAFPAAAAGQRRVVILLPHKGRAEEGAYRVELLVGKRVMTDGVNIYSLGGAVEERELEGWGFTYYEVATFGSTAATRMGVVGAARQVEKLVTISSELIRYNSRVPLVVYVPEEGVVRYRVWCAGETIEVPSE